MGTQSHYHHHYINSGGSSSERSISLSSLSRIAISAALSQL